jgi:hypothetical protein
MRQPVLKDKFWDSSTNILILILIPGFYRSTGFGIDPIDPIFKIKKPQTFVWGLERKTRLELATTSLEGWSSTN